ncbi:MAG: riboflavin biosynthesis protein RibF [Oscillospiraceae bacterium]|nr:riboflavin biosynthesis protein RibF [Oscillospiraceae bacterium]
MDIFYDISNVNSKPSVIAVGFFDGVHIGHISVIKKAVEIGKKNKLYPSLFTFRMDKFFPEKKKEIKRIIPIYKKLDIFKNLGIKQTFIPCLDDIIDLSPIEFIEDVLLNKFNAKSIICGEDFRFGKFAKGDVNLLKSVSEKYNFTLHIIKNIDLLGEKVSSTNIRKKISLGDFKEVNRYLGYRYFIEEEVLIGRRLGRQLGFPTINQLIPDDIVHPRYGIYASITYFDKKIYKSVSHIGIKPSVETTSKKIFLETNIFDFDKNVYNKILKVELLEFIGEEEKFSSMYDLKKQIEFYSKKSYEICDNYI